MNKKEFRLNINKDINNKESKSKVISYLLYNELKNYKSIALYAAMNDEVNLDSLITRLINEGKTVSLPRINNDKLDFYIINSLDELNISNNKYKIREPISNNIINKDNIDIMVIPGVAFDINLNRMGHGKGYYDKYLEDFKGIKTGVCFGELLFDNIPTDTHDIKMDMIITNEKRFAK
ncbi:MAG: 5-formyltetrahydrofolate cyclo-ligase [Acholeplasmatales bacterium]|nr:5-formyltetrahydrofolate cyclo-ligase [Acholeplasmatales bacterium]